MPQFNTPVTQRAYTLKIKGLNENGQDWQEALWQSHWLINRGARVFGNFLLTLCGGLSHELVENAEHILKLKEKLAKAGAGKKREEAQMNLQNAQRDSRIMLTLGWLSVEAGFAAAGEGPFEKGDGKKKWEVAKANDQDRPAKVGLALRKILQQRGVVGQAATDWAAEVEPTLQSAIRKDAKWVNRSAAFDELCKEVSGLDRDEAAKAMSRVFGKAEGWLTVAEKSDEKEFPQTAREFVSSNFGGGKKSNPRQIIQVLKAALKALDQADWKKQSGKEVIAAMAKKVGATKTTAEGIKDVVGWQGRSSAGRMDLYRFAALPKITEKDIKRLHEKIGLDIEKAQKEFTMGKKLRMAEAVQDLLEKRLNLKLTGKHLGAQADTISPMLDHAARRVSIAHSWAMRAEISRRELVEALEKFDNIPEEARNYLDRYCQQRGDESGSLDGYLIRKKALGGWNEVVKAWRNCEDAEEREKAVREIQRDYEKKFGDVNLFYQLAEDEAQVVWKNRPSILKDYVVARKAEKKSFKVPAYRHPDPFCHPVFAELGSSRWGIRYMAHVLRGKGDNPMDVKKDALRNWGLRDLQMRLWNGKKMENHRFYWQSKRLSSDLGLNEDPNKDGTPVARLDRLGRSIADKGEPQIRDIWNKKDWNGRLQAERRDLEHLGKYVEKNGWDSKAEGMKRRIDWTLTFSMSMRGNGPLLDYAVKRSISIPKTFDGYCLAASKRPEDWLKRHDLCHLPGLRVLSVDLGHRAAASCAVWEALSSDDFEAECRQRGVVKPNFTDLYLAHPSGRGQTIYRRVAADNSPAPWARLDRQFAIRLQGEGKKTRKPRKDEKERLKKLWNFVGRIKEFDREDILRVDEYQREAVQLLRQGLRRHGDRARIAYYLAGKAKPLPGGREKELSRPDATTEALLKWYSLLAQQDWQDEAMRNLWNKHVKQEVTETTSSSRGKKKREETEALRNRMKPVANRLAKEVSKLDDLAKEIGKRWKSDDEEWKRQLKEISHWLMPRGLRILKGDNLTTHKDKRAAQKAARYTGGLSMMRITTLRGMWKSQKSFFQRPEPDDLRKNIPEKDDDSAQKFGQKSLDRFKHLREQRVKQLSSRIIEAALGLGAEPGNTDSGKHSSKRMRTLSDDKRFAPCHAIVIENLDDYRPDELYTRRENRRLMEWASGKVRDYLAQGCELYGLLLRQIFPKHTSKQDSRTGAPGQRCNDMSIRKFPDAFWQERIDKVKKKKEAERTPNDQYLLECQKFAKQWKSKTKNKRQDCLLLRIPQKGGQVFVSADKHSPIAGGLQADLNAACNIGLRALTDPVWPGKWWWVRCNSKDGTVDKDLAVKNGLFSKKDVMLDTSQKGKGEKTDVWRDVTGVLNKDKNLWSSTTIYWKDVEARVCEKLQKRLKTS